MNKCAFYRSMGVSTRDDRVVVLRLHTIYSSHEAIKKSLRGTEDHFLIPVSISVSILFSNSFSITIVTLYGWWGVRDWKRQWKPLYDWGLSRDCYEYPFLHSLLSPPG